MVQRRPPNRLPGFLSWVLFSVLLLTTGFIVLGQVTTIRNDLQAQYYSEFSRIFDASLIFGKKVYGQITPWPLLDPGRAILDSVVYLLPEPSLLAFRAWNVILWIAIPWFIALSLAKRFKGLNRLAFWSLVFYIILYLNQGPVYYHLLIAPVLIFIGYGRDRFWRTLVAVIAASIWVGICRINWFPVPGMLAAFLYLIEKPRRDQTWRLYLQMPVIWILVGTGMAFMSYIFYSQWTGNPMVASDPTFNYSFWPMRLLPNDQYILGVFPGLVLVTLPLVIFLTLWLFNNGKFIDRTRIFIILGILGLFLIGGLFVSIRIGGTFNLHNMDAFLIFLLVLSVYTYFGALSLDGKKMPVEALTGFPGTLLVVAIILTPVIYNLAFNNDLQAKTTTKNTPDYAELQSAIDNYAVEGKPVLFIDYRHLLAFHEIQAPLYLPYEKVTLMEMAMANKLPYLNEFREKIKAGEFSVIVSSGHDYRFSTAEDTIIYPEENYWSEYVSAPIKKQYQSVYKLGKLQLWVPKAQE